MNCNSTIPGVDQIYNAYNLDKKTISENQKDFSSYQDPYYNQVDSSYLNYYDQSKIFPVENNSYQNNQDE